MRKKAILVLVGMLFLSLVVILPEGQARDLTKLGLKPSYNLGGATVTYISWTADRMKNYFNEDPVVKGRLTEAEKKFNCKIQFLQTRDIPATNMARLLAGDSAYDLWHTQTRIGYYELVSEGAAYPMDEILPEKYYAGLSHMEREAIKILEFKGHRWGIGGTHWGAGLWNGGSLIVYYNKSILEREGLPDPYKLYRENKWTWDQATEIVKRATQDKNGDGAIDQWGISRVVPEGLIVLNNGSVTRMDKNGRPVFTMDEPAALEALQLYADWNRMGAIGGKFVNGDAALDMHFIGSGVDNMKMKDEWSVVPIPRGPRCDQYLFPHWSPETVIIPVNSKNPEAMAALNAFIFREEDVTMNLALARLVRTREAAEIFRRIQTDWAGESRSLFEAFGGKLIEETIKKVIAGEKSPAVAMAEIKPVVQAELDQLFSK